jgi:phage major head subunit gpT-like protein
MAVVTSDIIAFTLAGIKTNFNTAYIRALQNAEYKEIATEISTTLPVQNYAWLGRGAVMQPFVDEAPEQSLREDTYQVSDVTYKANLEIQRRAIEDDQYGVLMAQARQLGDEAPRHMNYLSFIGLVNGFANSCYDGYSFFNSSHQEGSSPVQSNMTTASLSDNALQKAQAAMRSMLDDKGIPLEVKPNTLVVGPALERIAYDLVGSDVVVSRSIDSPTATVPYSNYFRGRYKVVVSDYLINGTIGAGANAQTVNAAYNWFLLDTNREIRPIIIQSRSDIPISIETDFDVATAKIRERFQVTLRGRYAQAYGLWQTAYGSSATS